jgi:hypothetical protein
MGFLNGGGVSYLWGRIKSSLGFYAKKTEIDELLGNYAPKWDVLWTNSAPTVAFDAQDITIDGLSDYNALYVLCKLNTNAGCNRAGTTVYLDPTSNETVRGACAVTYYYTSGSTDYANITGRRYVVGDGKLSFETGYFFSPTASAVTKSGTSYCIPVAILGTKIAGETLDEQIATSLIQLGEAVETAQTTAESARVKVEALEDVVYGGTLTAEDDGAGNVTVTVDTSYTLIVEDDDAGNVTVKFG